MTSPADNTPHDAGHEADAVNIRMILLTAAGLVVIVLGSLAMMSGYVSVLEDSTEQPEPVSTVAPAESRTSRRGLDPDQRDHRLRFEASQQQLLGSWQWLNGQQQSARIPIDRAMQLIEARYQTDGNQEATDE